MDKKKYQDGDAVKRGNNAARRREKERMQDVRAGSTAPTESLRPKMRPKTVDVSPSAEAADQEHVEKFTESGVVRGFKPGQRSGKNFSGTF
jgi:rhamnose utilization protein RhaD (predicted bifunctional aldolase and dehydrogenase)